MIHKENNELVEYQSSVCCGKGKSAGKMHEHGTARF
jgi:hypothetical protein